MATPPQSRAEMVAQHSGLNGETPIRDPVDVGRPVHHELLPANVRCRMRQHPDRNKDKECACLCVRV